MIRTDEISVVIQGPTDSIHTSECIASIRSVLPGAEIIISTWEGEEIFGAPDKVVFNRDPGGDEYCQENDRKYNNVNRQIVSTINGLRQCSRLYALKLRNDVLLKNQNFLKLFETFNADSLPTCTKKTLKKSVVVSSVFTRNPKRFYPFPFHLSDLTFFGLKDDIVDIFDIPLAPKEVTCYFNKAFRPDIDLYPKINARFTPEQYIMLTFLRKKMVDIRCDYMWDVSNGIVENYEEILASNFIVAEPKRLGMHFTKFKIGWRDWFSTYAFDEWKQLHDHYVLGKRTFALTAFLKNLFYPLWKIKKNRRFKRLRDYSDFKKQEKSS